ERLLALRELIWRLDTALLPLFDPLEEVCTKALHAIDCQQKVIIVDDGSAAHLGHVQWSSVGDAWWPLALALARSARERGDRSVFDKWIECLIAFTRDNVEVAQHVAYERCLWSLARLGYGALEQHLSQWNPTRTDPVWMLRKAGILAEIDRLQDAITLLKDALTEIR